MRNSLIGLKSVLPLPLSLSLSQMCWVDLLIDGFLSHLEVQG